MITDVTGPFAGPRAACIPMRGNLSSDVGLATLIGTDAGPLKGRDALRPLAKLDERISTIARRRRKAGLEVRSKRYDRALRPGRAATPGLAEDGGPPDPAKLTGGRQAARVPCGSRGLCP